MKRIIAVTLIALATYTATTTYTTDATVIDNSDNVVTIIDNTGNEWTMTDRADLTAGTKLTMIMNNSNTAEKVEDDRIVYEIKK